MSTDKKISRAELCQEPYVSIVCYPKPSAREMLRRLRQLEMLGISSLQFSGRKQIGSLSVLGKGCVGLVLNAFKNRKHVALKIRRTDANRESMFREAELLKTANLVRVGPRMIGVSKDFLVMQLVEGEMFPEWFERERGREGIMRVLRNLFEQGWRLDSVGLDHGQLSFAPKHIIVASTGKPFIIDFETASLDRRPANVTSIAQFLLSGGGSKAVCHIKLNLEALRTYKKNRTRINFEKILESCGF